MSEPGLQTTVQGDNVIEGSFISPKEEALNKWGDELPAASQKRIEDAFVRLITVNTALIGGLLTAATNSKINLVVAVISVALFVTSLGISLFNASPKRKLIDLDDYNQLRQYREEVLGTRSDALFVAGIIFAFGLIVGVVGIFCCLFSS